MSDFYGPASPPVLGDPRLDPPMVCRVEDWERRLDPTVSRAIRVGGNGLPWVVVTGPGAPYLAVHERVASWPIAHGLLQATAFRHSSTESAPAQSSERGDMTVEAFRTPKDTP